MHVDIEAAAAARRRLGKALEGKLVGPGVHVAMSVADVKALIEHYDDLLVEVEITRIARQMGTGANTPRDVPADGAVGSELYHG